jgi:DNA repair exonuclease SbcCD nuclease subunit
MKIALLADTHFGARSDSTSFDRYFRKFYEEVFFPYLKKHKIKTIIHLGDVFDKRKNVNFQTLHSCTNYFFKKLKEEGIHMSIMVGNHDTFFKNTNEINSPELLLSGYDNIDIYTGPTVWRDEILFLPWICDDTASDTADLIESSDADICLGHLEIAGFAMYKGMVNANGLDPAIFDKFKITCSGHFHHRDVGGRVCYLGSPYEMTWSDYDDPRGFHILDTNENKLSFVRNPNRMFRKVYWDDSKDQSDLPSPKDLAGMCIRVIVIHKEKHGLFDEYIEKLDKNGAEDVKILEDFSDFETDAVEDEDLSIEDTISMLNGYVDLLETKVDKSRLKLELQSLYIEAQNTDA